MRFLYIFMSFCIVAQAFGQSYYVKTDVPVHSVVDPNGNLISVSTLLVPKGTQVKVIEDHIVFPDIGLQEVKLEVVNSPSSSLKPGTKFSMPYAGRQDPYLSVSKPHTQEQGIVVIVKTGDSAVAKKTFIVQEKAVMPVDHKAAADCLPSKPAVSADTSQNFQVTADALNVSSLSHNAAVVSPMESLIASYILKVREKGDYLIKKDRNGKKVQIKKNISQKVLDQRASDAVKTAKTLISESKKRGLDLTWLVAWMQTESHFDPLAISNQDARGLFQLLPTTAAEEAGMKSSSNKKARVSDEQIYKIEVNVPLGVNHIQRLLEKYHYNLYDSMTAYDWGEGHYDAYKNHTLYTGSDPAYRNKYITELPDEAKNYASTIAGHQKEIATYMSHSNLDYATNN